MSKSPVPWPGCMAEEGVSRKNPTEPTGILYILHSDNTLRKRKAPSTDRSSVRTPWKAYSCYATITYLKPAEHKLWQCGTILSYCAWGEKLLHSFFVRPQRPSSSLAIRPEAIGPTAHSQVRTAPALYSTQHSVLQQEQGSWDEQPQGP